MKQDMILILDLGSRWVFTVRFIPMTLPWQRFKLYPT